MTEDPLTNDELAQLARAGWRIGGGGLYDGVVKVGGVKDGKWVLKTRAEWREVIASLPTAPVAHQPEETRATMSIYDLGSGGIGILEQEIVNLRAELVHAYTLALESNNALSQARAENAALVVAAHELKECTRKWQRDHIISLEMIRALDVLDAAVKASGE